MAEKLTDEQKLEKLAKTELPLRFNKQECSTGYNGKRQAKYFPSIEPRDIQNLFDDVFGAGGWQEDEYKRAGEVVFGRIGIRINGEWVWKSDVGEDAGYANDRKNFEEEKRYLEIQKKDIIRAQTRDGKNYDTLLDENERKYKNILIQIAGIAPSAKNATTDCLKRIAVKWGVMRWLYYLDPIYIEMDNEDRYVDKKGQAIQDVQAYCQRIVDDRRKEIFPEEKPVKKKESTAA